MENQNQNQNQIITIDTADIQVGLSMIEQEQLFMFLAKCREARQYRGQTPLQGIFVRVEDPSFDEVVKTYQKWHPMPEDTQNTDN
ncbi:hypothetical protein PR1_126 [Providencia phage vB_PreS_PR1]|uniref:Uncharacterized protein n=1 Tax=Providencia phage vB_PreS_PR1 TaxID=1931407 RepID=A0A1S6KV89_9CAUD|nr:hypothetical protein FDH30_gp088 [Providencia phage vB_PreS_PR1]AQT25334.1 hypothetical protein PR1_126 [Providencia phage vB_PreS_PR1]